MRLPSRESPLTSPLHQLLIPPPPPPLLTLVIFFLTFSAPLPPPLPVLSLFPPPPSFLPVCSSFQACQSGSGEKSLRMPNLTKYSRPTQRVAVEMGSDLPKLDSLAVSLPRFYYFLLSIVACCSPHCCFFHSALLRISFSPLLATQVFSLQNFYNRCGGMTDDSDT